MGVRGTLFWDRDSDEYGNLIRPDVRRAAHAVWSKAQRMACSLLGGTDDAAEIFESCVARVSRYLDRRQELMSSDRTEAVLLLAFRQALYDVLAKRRTLESIANDAELDEGIKGIPWQREIEFRLDFEKLLVRLSQQSRKMLLLRNAGYQWLEIAVLLGTTPSQSRTRLWRELQKLRSKDPGRLPQETSHESGPDDPLNDRVPESIPPPD